MSRFHLCQRAEKVAVPTIRPGFPPVRSKGRLAKSSRARARLAPGFAPPLCRPAKKQVGRAFLDNAGGQTGREESREVDSAGVPATAPLNQVITGWREALQLAKVGNKSRLVCPLAYGSFGCAEGHAERCSPLFKGSGRSDRANRSGRTGKEPRRCSRPACLLTPRTPRPHRRTPTRR